MIVLWSEDDEKRGPVKGEFRWSDEEREKQARILDRLDELGTDMRAKPRIVKP